MCVNIAHFKNGTHNLGMFTAKPKKSLRPTEKAVPAFTNFLYEQLFSSALALKKFFFQVQTT